MQTINLSKKQRINLSKSAAAGLSTIHFGADWGKIKRLLRDEDVDLDASISMFRGNRCAGTVYFGNLQNSFIKHSGDDLTGDSEADDSDNETITVDLTNVPADIDSMFLYLNSFSGQTFDKIPHAGIRVYEGQPDRPTNIMARFNLANDPTFNGRTGIVFGKLFKEHGEWQFEAIGEAIQSTRIDSTVDHIVRNYL